MARHQFADGTIGEVENAPSSRTESMRDKMQREALKKENAKAAISEAQTLPELRQAIKDLMGIE